MTRIVPFDPAHCRGATAHPSQARYQDNLDDPRCFEEFWPSTYSALDDGELIAIGGPVLAQGKWACWILFTDRITPASFVRIHRAAVRLLGRFDRAGRPLFMHVDPDNPAAARWAGLLGMGASQLDVTPDGRRMVRMTMKALTS